MLTANLLADLGSTEILDFGLGVKPDTFQFLDTHCIVPTHCFGLRSCRSGKCKASNILMAGFDGYPSGDPRNEETALILNLFRQAIGGDPLVCLTPTTHSLCCQSIYSFL